MQHNNNEIISIIGTGYVGLTTAAVLANAGYKVYTIDIDEDKINTIKKGKSYFYEVGLDKFVKRGIESGNLIPTTSYKESIPNSTIVFSCVGTPDKEDGSPNLDFIYAAAESFSKYAKNGVIYVQKSTVPVGTGKALMKFIKEKNPELKLSYVSNPEFLAESSALFDTLNMDRIVVGGDDKESIERVVGLYRSIDKLSSETNLEEIAEFAGTYKNKVEKFANGNFEDRVVRTSLESAELIKVTANACLALKISFANSIALLCDKTGADVNEVMDGVGMDHRIGRAFLYAGLGWGGGCFPKDVSGLISVSEEYDVDPKIMKAAVWTNDEMSEFVVGKLKEKFKTLDKLSIAVLGLAFKPGTSDVRKSPSIKLANKLVGVGIKVRAYDPEAMEEARQKLNEKVGLLESLEDVVRDADVIILATEWPEFINADYGKIKELMKGNLIIDARNRFDKEALKEMGFEYVGVGRL